jgi:hypothetical protein
MRRKAYKQNDGLKLKVLTSKADPQMAVITEKFRFEEVGEMTKRFKES